MPNVAGRRPRKDEPSDDARVDAPLVRTPARRRPMPAVPTTSVEAEPTPVAEPEVVEPEVVEPEVVEPEVVEPEVVVAPTPSSGAAPLAVCAVVLALLLASIGWLVYLDSRSAPRVQQPVIGANDIYTPGTLSNSSGAAAIKASVAHVPLVLGYDYRSLDAGLATALKQLTPGYASQFTSTFNTVVRPVAVKNKAVVKTFVRAAGLVSQTGDSATVLIFVDEALVSAGSKTTPTINQDRVRVNLIRSKGLWLIDGITPL